MTDIEIAQSVQPLQIQEIADKLNIPEEAIEPYGHYKAKIDISKINNSRKQGKVILVTAINPTPAGEGKSTVTIGLGDALNKLGDQTTIALREPSLGPVFGVKGGATGGGYAQVIPMEDINLHFTGDMHAITSAVNLVAALIDNHIHQGNALNINPTKIVWHRVLDMNDRALRNIVVGLGSSNSFLREEHFDITVASEVMAILCLSNDLEDFKEKIGNCLIGYRFNKTPVFLKELHCEGAVATLMKDAIKPNLVQTLEGTPVLMHGGPFANIAHGCNSIIATNLATNLSDYVVTEAGFGADLGAEKFMDITCRAGVLCPSCVVIVATIKALKMHGGVKKEDLNKSNIIALEDGVCNLEKHIENIKKYNVPYIIALNKYISDSKEELDFILDWSKRNNHPISLTEVWEKGSEGGLDLAEKVYNLTKQEFHFHSLYFISDSIKDKINIIAKEIYGAKNVVYSTKAEKQISEINKINFKLPVCIAKTQYSLSDDPKLLGVPKDFTLHIKEVKLCSGAGFIVVYAGDIMTMPGLPKVPAANSIDIINNKVYGLF